MIKICTEIDIITIMFENGNILLERINSNAMKTKKNQRRNRIAKFKESIRQNNLMNRFIYEIEREEPLEKDVLSTMFAYQVQIVK